MKRVYLIACFGIVLVAGVMTHTQLVVNRSESLPYNTFLVVKNIPVKSGDLVHIKGHPTAYVEGVNFTKRIEAVEGDLVPHPPLQTKTRSGKMLSPLEFIVVPAGQVYVTAPHARSFDSRYAEFGCVKRAHIVGKAYPLW